MKRKLKKYSEMYKNRYMGLDNIKAAITIQLGQTEQLTVIISPENASNKDVTWSTTSGSSVSVSSEGIVTALTKGSAIVRATSTQNTEKY